MVSFKKDKNKKGSSIPVRPGLLVLLYLTLAKNAVKNSKLCDSDECRFSEYVSQNKIQFVSPLEKQYRFKIFTRNLREIETFNEAHPEIKLNLNGFGLLTRKEFKQEMTNPDFLFVDEAGRKHHVNVNDPRNEQVIDQQILNTNNDALKAIHNEIKKNGNANALTMLEWDIEKADEAIQSELDRIHDFLSQHESKIEDQTELLDADGCRENIILGRVFG